MRSYLYCTFILFVPSLNSFLQLHVHPSQPSSVVCNVLCAKKARRRDNHQTSTKNEVSPFYRCDRRYAGSFQVNNATGLASLLQQRFYARKGQAQGKPGNQENVIQRIDRELRQRHNVRVTDRPPIWAPFNSTPPLSFYRQKKEALGKRLDDLYGPLGHPYRQMGDASKASLVDCPLSEPEIHQRLRRISACRFLEGRGEEVDALIFELSLLGVRISDEHSGWTNDPDYQFTTLAPPSENRAPTRNSTIASYIPIGVQIRDLENAVRIEQLLNMRCKALAIGNHELSDYLALELFETYTVRCDDILKTWCVDGENSQWHGNSARSLFEESLRQKFIAQKADRDSEKALRQKLATIPLLFAENASEFNSPSFALSDLSKPLESFSSDRVIDLVQQRIHKREEGRFRIADAIRKELWSTYNVGINDRLREYSIGGKFQRPSINSK